MLYTHGPQCAQKNQSLRACACTQNAHKGSACIECMHMHGVTGSLVRILVHEYIEAHKKFRLISFTHSRATAIQSLPLIYAHILIITEFHCNEDVCMY